MWHSLIAFIDNKTLFQIGIGLCRISFPMRLLLPFERGRPLLQLSSDDSSPAVDSDLSQQKKKKKQTNPNITNLSPLMTRWQPPQPKLPSPGSGSEVTKQRWILRNQRLSHKIPPRNWKSRGHLPKESSPHRFNDKIALLRGPLTTLLNVARS